MTDTQQKQTPTINGIPLTELSELAKAVYSKLITIIKDIENYKKEIEKKELVKEELSDILSEELQKYLMEKEAKAKEVKTNNPDEIPVQFLG